jgi:hypothetical protein
MWFKRSRRWDLQADVVVVGTGAAGMTAAIAAHDRGAEVVIVDKAAVVGGTTAVSGGVVWVPNNHHMRAAGIADSRAEALAYTRRLADGRSDDALIERFLDVAPEMLSFIEEKTPVTFAALTRYPDYHPEFEGGKPGGRSLDPGLYDTGRLGAWKSKLRRSPVFGMTAMSIQEATEWGVFSNPLALPFDLLAKRFKQGLVCYGGALAGGLLEALLDRGIEPVLGAAARELLRDGDRVAGLHVEQDGGERLIEARGGVILASGGFEWNQALCTRFLGGVLTHPNSPPTNDGDGLQMAMAVGAELGNMSEAWWCPSVMIPGEEYDGQQLHRGDFAIRSLPHSLIVNRRGRRFVNEAHNYNDMMKPFFTFDPVSYERPTARLAAARRHPRRARRDHRRRRRGPGRHRRPLQPLRRRGRGQRLPPRRERLRSLLRRPEPRAQPQPGRPHRAAVLRPRGPPRRHRHQGRRPGRQSRPGAAGRGRAHRRAVRRRERHGRRDRVRLPGRRQHHRRRHDLRLHRRGRRGHTAPTVRRPSCPRSSTPRE